MSAAAKSIVSLAFDWVYADLTSGLVRCTAPGATAGFGASKEDALAEALRKTARDVTEDHGDIGRGVLMAVVGSDAGRAWVTP